LSVDVRYRIAVPPDCVDPVILPETVEWNGIDGSSASFATVESKEDDGTLQIEVSSGIELRPELYPPEAFAKLIELNRILSNPRMRTLLIRRAK
jgi:hypothetical protein